MIRSASPLPTWRERRGVAVEVGLVVAAVFLLGGLLGTGFLVLAARSDRGSEFHQFFGRFSETTLRPGPDAAPPQDLVARIEEGGLWESVRIVDDTVVVGSPSAEPEPPDWSELLERHGWVSAEITLGPKFVFVFERLTRGEADVSAVVLPLLVAQTLAMLVVALVARRRRVAPIVPRTDAGRAVWIGLALGAAGLAGAAALEWLLARLQLPVREQAWAVATLAEPRKHPWLLVFIAIVGPVAEEVFFRGYVFSRLRQVVGRIWAYGFASAVFTAAHLNPTAIPVYFCLGLLLAYAYERTGRLLTAVLMHATLNSAIVLRAIASAG